MQRHASKREAAKATAKAAKLARPPRVVEAVSPGAIALRTLRALDQLLLTDASAKAVLQAEMRRGLPVTPETSPTVLQRLQGTVSVRVWALLRRVEAAWLTAVVGACGPSSGTSGGAGSWRRCSYGRQGCCRRDGCAQLCVCCVSVCLRVCVL